MSPLTRTQETQARGLTHAGAHCYQLAATVRTEIDAAATWGTGMGIKVPLNLTSNSISLPSTVVWSPGELTISLRSVELTQLLSDILDYTQPQRTLHIILGSHSCGRQEPYVTPYPVQPSCPSLSRAATMPSNTWGVSSQEHIGSQPKNAHHQPSPMAHPVKKENTPTAFLISADSVDPDPGWEEFVEIMV